MQFGSYLRIIAATMGFFGVILTILGIVYLRAHQAAGLSAVPWEKLSLEQLQNLTAQRSFLVSGLTLIVLSILGLVAPWVFNFAERQVFEGYSWIAIYAGVSLGAVISLFVYGVIAAFNEWQLEI